MVFVANKDPVCKHIAPEAQAHAAGQERACLVPDQKHSGRASLHLVLRNIYSELQPDEDRQQHIALAAVSLHFPPN